MLDEGLEYYKVSRRVFFKTKDLENWIEIKMEKSMDSKQTTETDSEETVDNKDKTINKLRENKRLRTTIKSELIRKIF